MDRVIKRHIKILAEKYDLTIEYDKTIVVFENDINTIKLWQEDKYGISIQYNLKDQIRTVKIPIEGIYDFILELFGRKSDRVEIEEKTGKLITLNQWFEEEGEGANEQYEELRKDLKNRQITYRELGGNRIEAEYYKGILILSDDLRWDLSNVIDLWQECN